MGNNVMWIGVEGMLMMVYSWPTAQVAWLNAPAAKATKGGGATSHAHGCDECIMSQPRLTRASRISQKVETLQK